MSNSFITVDELTNESLRILHQKANFIGSINRQYDERFAKEGGKIGTSLRIRKPNQYTVRTGKVLDVQDQAEEATTLTVATQVGVDMSFDSSELTMTIDRFSERYLQPAMSRLAAYLERDAISMYKNVYNQVIPATATAALDYATIGQAHRKLVDGLAPMGDWCLNLGPRQVQDFIADVKSQFHDSEAIKKQYREGMMGRVSGFEVMQNSLWGQHTSGAVTTTEYDVDGASESGSSDTLKTGSGAFAIGDIFTLAGCNRVHPEAKFDTGELQQFTTDEAHAGSGDINVFPTIVTSGAKQNVADFPDDSGNVTVVGGSSKTYDIGMAYHPDAFTFVTADLVMPSGVDFSARKVLDGISMRVVRQYDINNDLFPLRFDILYGKLAIRPEIACRVASRLSS
jgi:hypothetical protein